MAAPAEQFVITRKRKKYKFAKFNEFDNCFEAYEFLQQSSNYLKHAKKIVVELGAGTARFLVAQARLHPTTLFIAIDLKSDRLYAGAKHALEQKFDNIIFVRANADQLFELMNKKRIDELWLTFSDPYPKKRHIKHRMTHPKFLRIYKNLLKKDGVLHFKTDNHQLFDWSLEQLVSYGGKISNLTFDLHTSHLPAHYKIMTAYEQRFVSQGQPIYQVDVRF